MSALPPRSHESVLMPMPLDIGEPLSVGIAYYRTSHELTFYLRALQHVGNGRLVVVLGLREGEQLRLTDLPTSVRLILTAPGAVHVDQRIGWVVPDPLRAVIVGMTGRQPDDGLILLFPDDWQGPSPEELVEKARRWRSGPHSPVDDVYFDA